MLNMAEHSETKLNRLMRELPEGLVVDAAWLTDKGYPTNLRSYYVSQGILEQPVKRLYRRPYGDMRWEQIVISLQTVLGVPVIVGGRTALTLEGFGHYISERTREIFLYAAKTPPSWLFELKLGVEFKVRNSERLFRNQPIHFGLTNLTHDLRSGKSNSQDPVHASVRRVPWGHWEWPLTLSTPERALLEMIDELPNRESFHIVDTMIDSMQTLSPRRMTKLLTDCRSVKVKRLFFYFASRHDLRWMKSLRPEAFDLGTGKRVLVKGGKLDPRFQITVPEDLDGGT